MSIPEQVWTVNKHINRIVKRPAQRVAKEIQEYERRWNGQFKLYAGVFNTEENAVEFLLSHAQAEVSNAAAKLKLAQAQLKRLQNKFGKAGKK